MTMPAPIPRTPATPSQRAAKSRRRGLGRAAVLLMVLAALAVCVPLLQAQAYLPVTVADFNHDGIPDVLVQPASETTTAAIVFGSVPYGSFSPSSKAVTFPPACTFFDPGSVLVGDLNGDGFPDIFFTCYTNSGLLAGTMLGNGDGTFAPPVTVPGVYGSTAVLGDFNHDGKLDLAVIGPTGPNGIYYSPQGIAFFAGNGDGTFAAPVFSTFASFTSYLSPVAVDVNGDGYPDLVLGNFGAMEGSLTVDVYGNNKDGTFGVVGDGSNTPNVSAAVGTYPNSFDVSILPGNYFGTGNTDFVVVDTGGTPGFWVVKNTSTATTYSLAAGVKTPYAGLIAGMAGSVTGSGLTDLVAANGSTLTVLANGGNGTFTANYSALALTSTTSLFAVADANADGYADIYTAASLNGALQVAANLVTGSATATSQPFSLLSGTQPISATWPGNVNFTGTTPTGTQQVNGVPTAASVTSSLNPSTFAQSVTLTATVASNYQPPAGSVIFMDGATAIGSATLTPASGLSSVATLTTSTLPAGTDPITVVYAATPIFGAATSLPLSQVVNKVPTTATVVSSLNPSTVGQSVLFTATVAGNFAAPTGQVVFMDGATAIGTATLTAASGLSSVATLTTSTLPSGTDPITVVYAATQNFGGTASPILSQVVNRITPTLTWANPASIVYGTALGAAQLNAAATISGGASVPGTYTYLPAAGTVLTVGAHTLGVTFTPTDPLTYLTVSAPVSLTVTQAAPVLTWPTPVGIAYGIPLTGTQLNATVAGVTGAALPGTLTYAPVAGTVLVPGTQTLTASFVPTDTLDYTSASGSVKLVVSSVSLTSFTPNTADLGDPNKTITLTGLGFVASSVVQVNGTAVPTTLVSPTSLTAVIPAADFALVGTLQITVLDPSISAASAALPLTVAAVPPTVTLSGPPTSVPGSQPSLNFAITNPYPVPLTATFTLTFAPAVSPAVDDPAIQFSNGSRTFSFTVPANSVAVPPIQLQAGTIAGTITIPTQLTAGGANVTPATLQPVVIVVPAVVPSVTGISVTRSGDQLTVVMDGFSNTREVSQATFQFTPASGDQVTTPQLTLPVTTVFSGWFSTAPSDPYGSTFSYTQIFNVNGGAAIVGAVQVTLTNSVGASIAQTAQ